MRHTHTLANNSGEWIFIHTAIYPTIKQLVFYIYQCKMGVYNKNLRTAFGLTIVAFILIFLAFVSPYWLVFDGKLNNPKFLNLGKSSKFE